MTIWPTVEEERAKSWKSNGPLLSVVFFIMTSLAAVAFAALFGGVHVIVAMVFIGLPFIVRTMEPVMSEIGQEVEEAAATLGATRVQTIFRVVLPMLTPTLLTGAAMAFARGVGEYGSIIFIAGNIPGVSEIAPLLIVTKLEQFDYAGASAIGVVMLGASFVMLLALNGLQGWAAKRR